MSIGLSYTIGSGAMHGTLGTVLGIGDITPDGGIATLVGHTIGIGVTVMHSTIITVVVRSTMRRLSAQDTMSYEPV
jgi:hypothetical protein